MRVNLQQVFSAFGLIGAVSVLVANPAYAEAVIGHSDFKSENRQETLGSKSGEFSQEILEKTTQVPSAQVPSSTDLLTEAKQPLEAMKKWVHQSITLSENTDTSVKVTSVQLKQTEVGIEVILQTADGSSPTSFESTYNQTYVADLINSKLQLPSGNEFHVDNPAPGIASVSVTQMYEHTVRVKVIGDGGLPTGRVITQSGQVVVSATPSAPTATKPSPAVTPTPTLPEGTSQVSPTPSESPTPAPPAETQPPATPPVTTQPPSTESQPGTETSPTAPETTQKPETPNDQQEIPTLEVIGKPDTGYRVPNATTGTRTDTPILLVPQTVQVVPRQVIEDQSDNNIGEILRNLGIIDDNSNNIDTVRIRGFQVLQSNSLKNGLRDSEIAGFRQNVTNIEQIEVLKGPASILYGNGSPGGIYNIVTKQPLSEPYYSIEGKVGTHAFYEPSLDISGPLTIDKKLLYRFNASYENSGSFIDHDYRERIFVAPIVTWQPNKDTKLTIEGDYQITHAPAVFEPLLPTVGTLLPNPNGKIPLNRYLGEPTLDRVEQMNGRIGYNFEHRFSDNWSVYNAFRYSFRNQPHDFNVLVNDLQPDNRTVTRSYQIIRPYAGSNFSQDTHVVGKFNTFGVGHQLLVGVDAFRDVLSNFGIDGGTFPSIDVYNPVYGQEPGPRRQGYVLNTKTEQLGVYVQDQLALANNLRVVVGGRWDFSESQTNLYFSSKSVTEQSDSAFSPRVGIVYQPIQPIALYASYSRSFDPQGSTDFFGKPFEPTRGTQYEVGVKTDLLNNKLSATLSFYQLTQTNILTGDPDHPGYSIQVGEARSRGIELYVAGELAPGWNIIASYNYTDPRITKDNTYEVGHLLTNFPENAASLWTTYIIPKGSWKGFGGGVGIFYVGDRSGDLSSNFTIPSYVRTDAALYYHHNNFQVGLNFKNLFDIAYFESADPYGVTYVRPRQIDLTFKWRF